MFVDYELEFSTAQTIATGKSTNVVSLLPSNGPRREIATGDDLYIVFSTPTALAGTSPTLTVNVETDDTAAFASPVVIGSKLLRPADFSNGRAILRVPNGAETFLRLDYVAGGTVSAGTITASIATDAQQFTANAAVV